MPAAVRAAATPVPPLGQTPPLPIEGAAWELWLRQARQILNLGGNAGFLVADLPSTTPANNPPGIEVPFEGQWAFALDGRKTGEGAGAGTGVPCYFSNGSWRRPADDSVVAA